MGHLWRSPIFYLSLFIDSYFLFEIHRRCKSVCYDVIVQIRYYYNYFSVLIIHLPSLRPPSRTRIPIFFRCAKSLSTVLSVTLNFSEVFPEIFSEIAFADKNGSAIINSKIIRCLPVSSFRTSLWTFSSNMPIYPLISLID